MNNLIIYFNITNNELRELWKIIPMDVKLLKNVELCNMAEYLSFRSMKLILGRK